MLIYKILRASELEQFRSAGVTKGAPVDLADGFIHFSTAEQAPGTAARHFEGEDNLTLVAVNTEKLGDALKWEPSRGGALFPHLYAKLSISDVAWMEPISKSSDGHVFPEAMT